MKLNPTKKAIKVTVFAAIFLAACFFTSTANAQSTFSGTFKLQHSVYWGTTELGAGDYSIKLDPLGNSDPMVAVIYYQPSGRVAARVSCANADTTSKGESALLVGHRGSHQVVHSFRVAELGRTFIYDRTLASRQGAEEAMSGDNVPVLEAKKQ